MTTRPSRWVSPDGPSDTTSIRVRANAQQRAAFAETAKLEGKSVSTWMRDLAIAATKECKPCQPA